MPPQPGIFALPYGTTHSQGGGLASSSQAGGGGGGGKASRGGLTSFPNSQQDSNIIGVVNGDMGLGGGSGYRHGSNSTQLQQQQHIQQHPSHHAQHSPLGHGHPLSHLHQNQHLHHNFHQHGGAVAGPSSRVHIVGSMDDTRKDNRKRKEISGKLGKEMGDRRDELSLFWFSLYLLSSLNNPATPVFFFLFQLMFYNRD
jgi:hypothetical protein